MKLHPHPLGPPPGTKPAAAAPQAPGLQLCLTFAPDPPGTKPEAPMGLLVIPNPFISVLNPLGQSLREKAALVGWGDGFCPSRRGLRAQNMALGTQNKALGAQNRALGA